MRAIPACLLGLSLSSCVASMAGSAVTSLAGTAIRAPFKVGSKAVDMATTNQAEADRNLGRKVRKQRERERREREESEREARVN